MSNVGPCDTTLKVAEDHYVSEVIDETRSKINLLNEASSNFTKSSSNFTSLYGLSTVSSGNELDQLRVSDGVAIAPACHIASAIASSSSDCDSMVTSTSCEGSGNSQTEHSLLPNLDHSEMKQLAYPSETIVADGDDESLAESEESLFKIISVVSLSQATSSDSTVSGSRVTSGDDNVVSAHQFKGLPAKPDVVSVLEGVIYHDGDGDSQLSEVDVSQFVQKQAQKMLNLNAFKANNQLHVTDANSKLNTSETGTDWMSDSSLDNYPSVNIDKQLMSLAEEDCIYNMEYLNKVRCMNPSLANSIEMDLWSSYYDSVMDHPDQWGKSPLVARNVSELPVYNSFFTTDKNLLERHKLYDQKLASIPFIKLVDCINFLFIAMLPDEVYAQMSYPHGHRQLRRQSHLQIESASRIIRKEQKKRKRTEGKEKTENKCGTKDCGLPRSNESYQNESLDTVNGLSCVSIRKTSETKLKKKSKENAPVTIGGLSVTLAPDVSDKTEVLRSEEFKAQASLTMNSNSCSYENPSSKPLNGLIATHCANPMPVALFAGHTLVMEMPERLRLGVQEMADGGKFAGPRVSEYDYTAMQPVVRLVRMPSSINKTLQRMWSFKSVKTKCRDELRQFLASRIESSPKQSSTIAAITVSSPVQCLADKQEKNTEQENRGLHFDTDAKLLLTKNNSIHKQDNYSAVLPAVLLQQRTRSLVSDDASTLQTTPPKRKKLNSDCDDNDKCLTTVISRSNFKPKKGDDSTLPETTSDSVHKSPEKLVEAKSSSPSGKHKSDKTDLAIISKKPETVPPSVRKADALKSRIEANRNVSDMTDLNSMLSQSKSAKHADEKIKSPVQATSRTGFVIPKKPNVSIGLGSERLKQEELERKRTVFNNTAVARSSVSNVSLQKPSSVSKLDVDSGRSVLAKIDHTLGQNNELKWGSVNQRGGVAGAARMPDNIGRGRGTGTALLERSQTNINQWIGSSLGSRATGQNTGQPFSTQTPSASSTGNKILLSTPPICNAQLNKLASDTWKTPVNVTQSAHPGSVFDIALSADRNPIVPRISPQHPVIPALSTTVESAGWVRIQIRDPLGLETPSDQLGEFSPAEFDDHNYMSRPMDEANNSPNRNNISAAQREFDHLEDIRTIAEAVQEVAVHGSISPGKSAKLLNLQARLTEAVDPTEEQRQCLKASLDCTGVSRPVLLATPRDALLPTPRALLETPGRSHNQTASPSRDVDQRIPTIISRTTSVQRSTMQKITASSDHCLTSETSYQANYYRNDMDINYQTSAAPFVDYDRFVAGVSNNCELYLNDNNRNGMSDISYSDQYEYENAQASTAPITRTGVVGTGAVAEVVYMQQETTSYPASNLGPSPRNMVDTKEKARRAEHAQKTVTKILDEIELLSVLIAIQSELTETKLPASCGNQQDDDNVSSIVGESCTTDIRAVENNTDSVDGRSLGSISPAQSSTASSSKHNRLAHKTSTTLAATRPNPEANDPKEVEKKVQELAKKALKPHFQKGKITPEEYKRIMKKALEKISKSKSGITEDKVTKFINAYVEKERAMRL